MVGGRAILPLPDRLQLRLVLPETKDKSGMADAIQSFPEEESNKASAKTTTHNGRWILATTILGSSMVFIDGSVVNVALPVLQADLKATVTEVQWIVEAYTLFLAALLLVGGSLGDHYGR